MSGIGDRIAGAPITWGVSEVPGWGHQMAAARVLREAAGAGFRAIELGPPGFLPADAAALRRLLASYGLGLAAGFLAAVLHDPARLDGALRAASATSALLANAGARVLVMAAETGHAGYETAADPSAGEWKLLARALERLRGAAAEHGVELVVHPHHGTLIASAVQTARLLEETDARLCIDTGHLLLGGADPVEVAGRAAAAGRVGHVHLKDVDAALAARVRRGEIRYRDAVERGLYRPLGAGDVDVDAVIGLLEASGYAGWYVLEQDAVVRSEPPEGEGPILDAGRSLRRMMEGVA